MNRFAVLHIVPVVGLVAAALRADEVSLESVPPVVVKTVPKAGADEVDAKLTEIKVTFSKEMEDRSWSWSGLSKESYPKVDGKPKYLADKRTCVLPVKLELVALGPGNCRADRPKCTFPAHRYALLDRTR
jgi:RNA polymerase sigma-70 factor (ECF subfamily)